MQKKHRYFGILLGFIILSSVVFLFVSSSEKANNFSWTRLDGKSEQLDEFKGKVVLVNFWATTCSGCIAEMPKLAKLQEKLGKNAYETLAVAMEYDEEKAIRNYVERNQWPFIFAHDTTNQAADAFGGVSLTPTSYLIDKKGKIVQKYVGEPDMTLLEQRILALQ
ncbi:TlpA family protein disulfide reductase [Chitinibacteraceae bacterium HSL-7]